MKSIKMLLVIVLTLAMIFTFAACGGSSDGSDQGSDQQEQGGTAAEGMPEYVYASVGGVNIMPGGNYADVEGKIGDETKPSERIEPCDPEVETADIEYYFEGVQLTTKEGGLIRMISLDFEAGGDNVLFGGKIGAGSTVDDVKALMGEPEEDGEDEYTLRYYFDKGNCMFYKGEDDPNTVTGVIIGYDDMA